MPTFGARQRLPRSRLSGWELAAVEHPWLGGRCHFYVGARVSQPPSLSPEPRSTDCNAAEAAYLTTLGVDPDTYCAMPVSFQLQLQAGGQVMRTQTPQGIQEVLVTTWVVALDLQHFKTPKTSLMVPDAAKAARPLAGVVPGVPAYWLVPRENLSPAGVDLLDAWNHASQTPAYRGGFASYDPEPDADNEPPSIGQFVPGIGIFVQAHAAEWDRGLQAAAALVEAEGLERLAFLRTAAIQQAEGATEARQIIAPGAKVGTCPTCKRGTTSKYCNGSLTEPHPRKRVQLQEPS